MLCVCSAHSEEAPDGKTEKVYFPFFEKEALEGFGYVLYPEKSGLLLSAYSENAEIAVTVEQDESAGAQEFLKSYIEGMKRYAFLTETPEILAWATNDGQSGAKTRISYRHNKAAEDEDAYTTDAFSVKLDENLFLLVVFNSWTEEAKQALTETEERFFKSFLLEKREVSKVHLAFVKNAREDEEGNQYVSLDFCQVVYDPEIFSVYAQNHEAQTVEYRLSKDALIWSYDINASIYMQSLTKSDAESLIEIAAHYYENKGFDIIYQIMFDSDNEIIWMMHYNAF